MGRKTLLASTTKKKTAVKKKPTAKKAVKASASKKAVSKKTGPKKASAAKKAPAVKAKAKTAVKKTTRKPAPKKPSLKKLLLKQFTIGAAKKSQKPVKVKKPAIKIPKAPPFVSGYGKKEAERVRALLFKTFDLKAGASKKAAATKTAKPDRKPPAKKTASKKTSPKKASAAKKAPAVKAKAKTAVKKTTRKPAPKKPSLKELLFQKFEVAANIQPVSVQKTTPLIPDAPPFVSGYDARDLEKIRSLLFKTFDLKAEGPAREPEPKQPETVSGPVEPARPVEPPAAATPIRTDTGSKMMRWGIGAVALLLALIVGASLSNRNKFYLKPVDGGLEVWRGKFAPAGKELVYKLNGAKVPNPLRQSYTKAEVSPILFGYFLDDADAQLDRPAGPDIAKMKTQLRDAAVFAPTKQLQARVVRRLKGIDFAMAIHRADVAMAKGSLPDLRMARTYLDRAYANATTDLQREYVTKTRMAIEQAMAGQREK
ncbi:MAG: hypothetical protein JRI36_01525 [Deltaproteobacteria bacterium]|nr:hypothetical protein [Deltaproteobacteria bacterium]